MDWENFRPSRATAICLALLSFSFLLMTFRITKKVQAFRSFLFYWISPSQESASNLIQFTRELGLRLPELVQAHQENIILKNEKKTFSLKENQLQEALLENQRLKQLLDLKFSLPFNLIPATVSGRDTQNWISTIWIDRGLNDRVLPNSPVLAVQGESLNNSQILGGVIGRVLECSLSSSKVMLISDPLSSLVVSLPRTGEQGLVNGQSSFSMTVEYLDPTSDIQIGDEVVTNGMGGIFPAGLSVGVLSKIITTSSGFKRAKLKPTVPLNKIREVLVLVPQSEHFSPNR